MGGEKAFPTFWSLKNSGSPPRGRGKADTVADVGQAVGITPAWAGKSKNCSGHCSAPPDHPRMGGEKNTVICHCVHLSGSPPHGRGKDVLLLDLPLHLGIIPA